MLAKLTSKNQLTLPKSVTDQLGAVQYFEVSLQAGQVLLTPVRIQRGDAVRAKLAELSIDDQAIDQALAWMPAGSARAPALKVARTATKAPTKAAAKKVSKAAKAVASAADIPPIEAPAEKTRAAAKAATTRRRRSA